MNIESLKELAQLNERAQEIRQQSNTSPLVDLSIIDAREHGVVDSLRYTKKAAKELISKEDMKGISSPDEFFDLLIKKTEQKMRKETDLNKEVLNSRVRRIELMDQLLTESEDNPNLNFVNVRKFPSNLKAIDTFKALEIIYPDKFKFESSQQMNIEGTQNSLSFLLHGNLEELKEVIKNTKELKFLKSIVNKTFDDYFEPHKDRGVIFENNKVIKLIEIDSEDVDLLLRNKTSRTNKI